jgi:hypothetical protein
LSLQAQEISIAGAVTVDHKTEREQEQALWKHFQKQIAACSFDGAVTAENESSCSDRIPGRDFNDGL